MSYTNTNNIYHQSSFPTYHNLAGGNTHQQQIDENIIHINKYRFMDFYYEELDKLNVKYYQKLDDDPRAVNFIHEEPINQYTTVQSHSLPVNIPVQNNIHRYRLDSLNNHLTNTPSSTPSSNPSFNPSVNGQQQIMMSMSGLDLSMSPPLTNSRSSTASNQHNSLLNGSAAISVYANTNPTTTNHNSSNILPPSGSSLTENHVVPQIPKPEYYTPSTSHQTIVKRVYDNYLCINIDNVIPHIQHAKQYPLPPQNSKYSVDTQNLINATYDFISDQCVFLVELIAGPDPFNLFNHTTIGLLFDRMNKSRFPFQQSSTELCKITAELTAKLSGKQLIKQGLLDSAISILKNSTDELLHPGVAVASVLVKSLTDIISWIYGNYSAYWMHESLIQTSLKIASSIAVRFGVQVVDDIYTTIKKYFIPSYLFSVSRTSWKFTNIHKREIARLRELLIPPSHKNQWIIKCIEQARAEIAWVFPDSPNIKNLVVFVDGRNCFYADEYQKTTGGVNLELLRRFLNLADYHNILADLVYGRITNLMTGGRQLNIRDPRYIILVVIFNERHRQQIQPLVPSNRTSNSIIVYTPRGQDDDLMTLYLWLSNPGSFIASNDNYGNHAARLTQSTHENQTRNCNLSKYYEGLWSELIRCFKLVNPIGNLPIGNHPRGMNTTNNIIPGFAEPGTTAPF